MQLSKLRFRYFPFFSISFPPMFGSAGQESSMTVMVLAPRSKRMMSGLVDERCLDVGKVNSVFHTLHDRLDLP
jgi:hypothetical protein